MWGRRGELVKNSLQKMARRPGIHSREQNHRGQSLITVRLSTLPITGVFTLFGLTPCQKLIMPMWTASLR